MWSRARAKPAPPAADAARARSALEPLPFLYATLAVAAALGDRRSADRAHADPESVDAVPAGGAVDRGEFRHLAGDLCVGPVVPGLQFLLYPADLHLHHRRALRTAGAGDFSGCRGDHLGARRPGARAGDDFGWPHAGDAAALRIHAPPVGAGVARCGCRRRRQRNPRQPRARGGGAVGAGRRSGTDRRLAAGRRARRRADDGGALGLQPRRAGGRRHRHVADRAVVFRAAADRRQDARGHRRCQVGGDRRRSIRKRARCSMRCPNKPPPRWSAPRSRATW